MRTLTLVLAFLLFALPVRAQGLGTALADGYATPQTAAFADAATGLSETLSTHCAEPAEGTLDEVRAAFSETVTAWARIAFLRFGPLVEENRFERIRFWPDPRGITLRQVQGTLSEQDPSDADPVKLKGKSVALQGLPALEYVLYGTDARKELAEAGAFRCAYAHAIAQTIAGRAEEIARAWAADGDMRRLFVEPGPDNPLYRSKTEVAAEAVKALSTGLQFLRDAELAPALGEEPGHANPKRAPFWRSELTVPTIRAGLTGMRDFMAAGIEDELADGDGWIANQIRFEIAQVLAVLRDVEGGFAEALTSPGGYDKLSYAAVALHSLRESVDGPLAAALGTRVGFNALDGD